MSFLSLKSVLLRSLLLGGLALYVGLFNWLYINWLVPTFGYMGMTYRPAEASLLALAWGLSLLPGLWIPLRLSRPSQILLWFLYLLVYIPSMFGPLYMALEPRADTVGLMLCLAFGMAILSVSSLLPLVRFDFSFISLPLFWVAVALLTAVLDIWVLTVFHGHLRLVGFTQIYELRSSSSEVAAGSGVDYAVMILSSVIDPLYMAWGLVSRRKSLVLFGFLNQVFLYATAGSKAVILSLAILVGLYFLIGRSGRWFGMKLVACVCVMLAILCLLATSSDLGGILQFALSFLFLRTFANGGYTTGIYANFFRSHPLTYLSSVHGIDRFVHYPYARSLGEVVGFYMSGNPDFDANAHFWATDGIAGFGPPGILLVSVLCLVVLWLLDSSAERHNIVLSSLLLAFVTMNLANVSLFTTLVSGGLGIAILLLLVMPSSRAVIHTPPRSMDA